MAGLTDSEKLQQTTSLLYFQQIQQQRMRKLQSDHDACGLLKYQSDHQVQNLQQKIREQDQNNSRLQQLQQQQNQQYQQQYQLLMQQQQQRQQQDSLLAQLERDQKDRLYRQLEVKVEQLEKNLAKKPISIDLTLKGKFPSPADKIYDEKLADDADSSAACVICLENRRNCLVRPCRHLSLCVTCSLETHKACPVCRASINGIERVFY